MEYFDLLNYKVSRIIFGCEPLGGTDWGVVNPIEIQKAIKKALDLGINCFDTADIYGLGVAEELLSKFLGNQRKESILITKFGVRWELTDQNSRAKTYKDISLSYLDYALHNSLKRLNVECIPIYFIHHPDGITPIEEVMYALAKYRAQGKIKAIGCSNFPLSLLKQAHNVYPLDIVQIQYSILERTHVADMVKFCSENNIKVIVYGALAQGLLSGKFSIDAHFPITDRRHRLPAFKGRNFHNNLKKVEIVNKIANEYNILCTQVAIKWLLNQKGVSGVITGIKNESQLLENTSVFDFDLTATSQGILDELVDIKTTH